MSAGFPSFVDRFRLPVFDTRAQEEAFWSWDDSNRLVFRTVFLAIAIATYGAVGFLDRLAGDEAAPRLLAIRAATIAILVLIVYRYTRGCATPSYRDKLVDAFGMTVGISIIITTLIAPRPAADFYPFLLSATMVFGSSLVVPRFATLAGICIKLNVLYWPTVMFSATSSEALYANTFVMTVTSFAVVVGAYTRETLEREQMLYRERLNVARKEAVSSRDDAIRASLAKSHLLANVSHELRTPMNAILGFSEMMKNEVFGPLDHRKYSGYVRDIHSAGTLLQSNIDDLLDVSRLEVDKMSWDDCWSPLSLIIEKAVQMCSRQADAAGIDLETHMDNDAINIFCDPDRMAQVLINLITNAVKFSGAGTKITVAVTSTDRETILSVTDQGCGIASEDLERICEPFGQVQTDSMTAKKGGMGLGLSIVTGLVEKFEGEMDINSVVGVGTRISLSVPSRRIFLRHAGQPSADTEQTLTLVVG